MQQNDDTTTAGLTPQQLAQLLGETVHTCADDEVATDQAKGEFLRLQLAGTAPATPEPTGASPLPFGRLIHPAQPGPQRVLGDVLRDPATPLDVLATIKEQAKARSARTDREVEYQVAITIYYAAIAAALVFRDHKLSNSSRPALAESFHRLTREPWIGPDLADLFTRAARACEQNGQIG